MGESSGPASSEQEHAEEAGLDGEGGPLQLVWAALGDGMLVAVNNWEVPVRVRLQVSSRIGPLQEELLAEEITLGASSRTHISSNWRSSMDMHAAQSREPTVIKARIVLLDSDGEFRFSRQADYRFVAPLADGPAALLNPSEIRDSLIASGRVGDGDGDGDGDGISLGSGSGLAVSYGNGHFARKVSRDGAFEERDDAYIVDTQSPRASGAVRETNPTDVELCFKFGIGYNDVGIGDYWTSNGVDRVAYGVRVKVLRQDVSTAWGGTNGTYTDAATGCTPEIDLTGGPFKIRMYSQARVGSGSLTSLKVYNNSTNLGRYYYNVASSADLDSDQTYEYTWDNSTWGFGLSSGSGSFYDVVNIIAAAAQSVRLYQFGTSGDTVRYFNDESCPTGAGSCTQENSTNTADVYISNSADDRKFVISHETGHAMAMLANQGDRASLDSGGQPGSGNACRRDQSGSSPSHNMLSQEYQSVAAHEGIAHAYAALVWNSTATDDCDFAYYKDLDIDQDGTWGESSSPDETDPTLSCEGSGSYTSWFDGKNYLEDECPTTWSNRATEYDWLRFWWDMVTEHDLSTSTIGDIWAGADPDTWDADGDVYGDIEDSANTELNSTMEAHWADEAGSNGVDN